MEHKALVNSLAIAILILLLFQFIAPPSTVSAKPSKRPTSDIEVRQRKSDCYADIESGLWGRECKTSMIAKENCALRCLSPSCYELVYQSDPLEEGEKDFVRSQEFKYCMHKLSLGEDISGIKGSFDY